MAEVLSAVCEAEEEVKQMSNKDLKPELVPMMLIVDNPYQARKAYDPDMLQRLADSIKAMGRLLQIPMATIYLTHKTRQLERIRNGKVISS